MTRAWLAETLHELDESNLRRRLRALDGPAGPRAEIGGRTLLNFASNNYLDLAAHPRVVAAATEALKTWGWGAGAAQLVSGFTAVHARLRDELAAFERAESCVLFPTGYQANLGLLGALAGRGDTVVLDKLDHASIIDGARLSGARVRVFPHGNLDKLARLLAGAPGRVLVIVDAVFSMDGDLAPLREIGALCAEREALLLVDEAHATGVLGETGAGLTERLRLHDEVDARAGTLSKALGGIGGFVVGSRNLCELVLSRGRSGIFTTALPPAAAAAALAALAVMREESWRRERLHARARELRALLRAGGVCVSDDPTPIVPVPVGDARAALALSDALRGDGILAPAIRPPTVPTSRLRLSVMATHSEDEIARAAERVCARLAELG